MTDITEKEVEAIFREAERKSKSLPGYSDAFNRVADSFRKFTEDGYVPNEADKKELDEAMANLFFVERFGPPETKP